MKMELVEMIGKRFGMATVIERAGSNRQNEACWKCICDCGNTFITRGSNLRTGNTKSCGCYMAINASRQFKTHGMSRSRIYFIWSSMKARCYNSNCKEYKFYGARGILICDEWKDSSRFFEWAINNGYRDDLTIERIDCNGNYEPCNCTFISKKEQGRNTRTVIRILSDGGYMTAKEVSELLSVSHSTIERMYHAGLIPTVDDAIRIVRERKEKYAKSYSYWSARK